MGDMERSETLVSIAAQGTIVGIEGVGGNQDVVWCGRTSNRYNDRGVLKDDPIKGELNDIAKLGFGKCGFDGNRPHRTVMGKKPVEILHAGPGRCATGGTIVIPPECGGWVHNTASGMNALGGKIRTVASDSVEVIVIGIAPEGPFVGILHGF
ncbi:hypothetical protein SDC9_82125 [bioreactor metagenome]|uniref:Uncharacterized protein n=1 Tax=bioreactor metagenome TaxID=1076179 RepID=A0A644Z407_9ZZZZ